MRDDVPRQQGVARHAVAPRTLLFLRRGGLWLFLEGAPHKWFAGRLNGLGGSVEPGEDVLAAARREALEETGLDPRALELAATFHVAAEPPVLLLVFLGELPPGDVCDGPEGALRWLPLDALDDPALPFVPDVRTLLPRLLARDGRVLHLATSGA